MLIERKKAESGYCRVDKEISQAVMAIIEIMPQTIQGIPESQKQIQEISELYKDNEVSDLHIHRKLGSVVDSLPNLGKGISTLFEALDQVSQFWLLLFTRSDYRVGISQASRISSKAPSSWSPNRVGKDRRLDDSHINGIIVVFLRYISRPIQRCISSILCKHDTQSRLGDVRWYVNAALIFCTTWTHVAHRRTTRLCLQIKTPVYQTGIVHRRLNLQPSCFTSHFRRSWNSYFDPSRKGNELLGCSRRRSTESVCRQCELILAFYILLVSIFTHCTVRARILGDSISQKYVRV